MGQVPEQRGPGLGGRDLRVWGRRSRSLGQSLEGLPLKLPPSRWWVEETRCSEEVKEGLPAQGHLSRLTQKVFHLVGIGGDGRMADSGGTWAWVKKDAPLHLTSMLFRQILQRVQENQYL